MSKIIAHIDLNAFFVRAEEIRNPKLINRPVAIGRDGRGGIVSTCSYKAREYGVRSGMPMFKAKELCKDLIIVPDDHLYYEVLSNEFIQIISQYSKIIEQASIDECYVDFTNCISKGQDAMKYFKEIQEHLYRETGLKCSIGVATTKFLAKMASDIKKPMGITIIRNKDIKKILFNNDVGTFFGIGKSTEKLLKNNQISTIGELYTKIKEKDPKICELMGKFTEDIVLCLEGKTSDEVKTDNEDAKSISCRTTLPNNTNEISELEYYLNQTFNTVKRRFQQTKMLVGGIEIAFRYVDLTTKTFSKKLDFMTNDTEILREEITKLFKNCYNHKELRQIGCAFERLTDSRDSLIQMSLFNYDQYNQNDPTEEIIKTFNNYIDDDKSKLFRASNLLKKDED